MGKHSDIAGYAAQGLCIDQIAEEIGISKQAVWQRAYRAGVRITHKDDVSLRTKAEGMKPAEAIDFLLGVIEAMQEGFSPLPISHQVVLNSLTRSEKRLFERLFQSQGAVVPHEILYNRLYCDRVSADEFPTEASVRIVMGRLRRKLRDTPWKITSVFGVGYYLEGPY